MTWAVEADAAVVRSLRTRAALTIRFTALHMAIVPADAQRDNPSKHSKAHTHSPWCGRPLCARSRSVLRPLRSMIMPTPHSPSETIIATMPKPCSFHVVSSPSVCTFAVGFATIAVHDQAECAKHEGDSQCEEAPAHRYSPSLNYTEVYASTKAVHGHAPPKMCSPRELVNECRYPVAPPAANVSQALRTPASTF